VSKYKRAYKPSTDKNELEIKKGLEKYGAIVQTGHDDLLVSYHDKLKQIEIKEQTPFTKKNTFKKGYIKPSQIKLLETMNDNYAICWTLQQCYDFLNGHDGDYITPSKYLENMLKWNPSSKLTPADIGFNNFVRGL